MHSVIWASVLLVLGASAEAALASRSHSSNDTDSYLHRQLWERQDSSDIVACPLSTRGQSTLADIFNHFGMIACDESLSNSPSLPFAVAANTFSNPVALNIVGNAESDCSGGLADIYNYGLVVGDTQDFQAQVTVEGNVFLANTDDTNVDVRGDQCATNSVTSGLVDFAKLRSGIYTASKFLAELTPDLKIDAAGEITELGTPQNAHFRVLTLNSCDQPADGTRQCSGLGVDDLSETGGIWTGGSAWTGPTNPEILDDAETVVINIPLTEGTTTLLVTNPSLKLENCKTIFNMYAVDSNGNFMDSGYTEFNVQYQGPDSAFEGLIISYGGVLSALTALRGKVLSTEDVFDVAGLFDEFSCGTYTACLPVEDLTLTENPLTTCTPETTITKTKSRTRTRTRGSTTFTDHTTTTATEEHTVEQGVTLTVTNSVTFTVPTTITSTYTTTYTSGGSTVTDVVTTTEPVFVPVENNDNKDGKDWGHGGDWEKDNWKKDNDWKKDGDWKKNGDKNEW